MPFGSAGNSQVTWILLGLRAVRFGAASPMGRSGRVCPTLVLLLPQPTAVQARRKKEYSVKGSRLSTVADVLGVASWSRSFTKRS